LPLQVLILLMLSVVKVHTNSEERKRDGKVLSKFEECVIQVAPTSSLLTLRILEGNENFLRTLRK
jgi:hypothetical protein